MKKQKKFQQRDVSRGSISERLHELAPEKSMAALQCIHERQQDGEQFVLSRSRVSGPQRPQYGLIETKPLQAVLLPFPDTVGLEESLLMADCLFLCSTP